MVLWVPGSGASASADHSGGGGGVVCMGVWGEGVSDVWDYS